MTDLYISVKFLNFWLHQTSNFSNFINILLHSLLDCFRQWQQPLVFKRKRKRKEKRKQKKENRKKKRKKDVGWGGSVEDGDKKNSPNQGRNYTVICVLTYSGDHKLGAELRTGINNIVRGKKCPLQQNIRMISFLILKPPPAWQLSLSI